ncbi:hypothetical protein [Streptomyces sp. NPDC058330]|uniref:hypothetical protein n=1 Tax=Streptomyces sp. NPDC058330 TaxID=3346449 RepID=UPI0036E3FD2A
MSLLTFAGAEPDRTSLDANPFVLHARQLRPEFRLEDTARFDADVWPLTPVLLKNQSRQMSLRFVRIPARFRVVIKEICYGMLSGPLPPGEDWPAPESVYAWFGEIIRFLDWMEARPTVLRDLTGDDLLDYQRFLTTVLKKEGGRTRARAAVRQFWRWRTVLTADRLRFDPRHVDGWGESKSRSRAGENSTSRIPEQVLGPLFAWALRFIDEFSPDILTAVDAWRQRRGDRSGPGFHQSRNLRQALGALLDEHVAAGRALPGLDGKLNKLHLARTLGCSRASLDHHRDLIDEAVAAVGISATTFFAIPITLDADGRPWVEGIATHHTHRNSLAALARHLHIACYIVIAYLSGMRDSEIKHLRRGCLTIERDEDQIPYRWKINSLAFKGEDDAAGVPATWSVGEPVARAVTALERLHRPDVHVLMSCTDFSPGSLDRKATERALTNSSTNTQLNEFVAWVNDYCSQHERADAVPQVNRRTFRLVTSQFRRTLAWFIARRPGGTIAGALAYRHHSVQVFEGYAGTSEAGFRAEVESEQALARGEHLMAMIDAHEHTALSGPAAEEAAERLEAFGHRARFQGQVALDERRLQRIMERHEPAIYPGKYVTCVHDHTKALCEKARRGRSEGLPDHGACRPLSCRNVALTPANIAAWLKEIHRIERRLKTRRIMPPLLRHRLIERRDEIVAFLARNTPHLEATA